MATSCRSRVVAACFAARARNPAGSVGCVGDQRSGHEQRRGVVRPRPVEDLAGGRGVAADQPEEQDLDVGGHGLTVLGGR